MGTIITTLIAGPLALREHLNAAHTQPPSLHPNVNAPDNGYRHPYRWSGHNTTEAQAWDALGHFLTVGLWHYADGSVHVTVHGPQWDNATLSSGADLWDRIAYPLEVAAPVSIVRHPEWTPGPDGQPIDPVMYASGRQAIAQREREAGVVAAWHEEV